jgi:hypothetical protein
MATRSERFRSDEERARARSTHPPKATTRPSTRTASDKQRLRAAEVSGTVHASNGVSNLSRGNLARGKKAGGYALEETVGSSAASRKSTRRSGSSHLKAATQLTSRQKAATASPARRHTKGK